MFGFEKKPKVRKRATKAAVPPTDLPKKNPLVENVKGKKYNGNTEHDDAVEVGTVMNLLKTVDAQIKRTVGAGYWVCLVFPDEDTCIKFMDEAQWNEFTAEGAYVDGLAVAQRLGIMLEVAPIKFKGRRTDRKLIDAVGTFDPVKGE